MVRRAPQKFTETCCDKLRALRRIWRIATQSARDRSLHAALG
jgi:hypothetical protein